MTFRPRSPVLGPRLVLLTIIAIATLHVSAENQPPRDIFPQAASAARDGDLDAASKKTTELTDTGRAYGLKRYPVYASAAAAFARQTAVEGKPDVSAWADKASGQLDPKSSASAFSSADMAADKSNWGRAIPALMRGFTYVFANYRTSVLGRVDLVFVIALAIALTAIIFAIALFIRYGRSMAHDFREMLGRRIHGG